MSTPGRKLVVLVGPTASGKTGLAVQLAARVAQPVEVVSLDSRQLYRHLDLGTGKPTAAERAAIPHHLIDCLDPDETSDAAGYRTAVEELLPTLWERGVVPLVVGGAGFYLRALQEGFFSLPTDPAGLAQVRGQLETQELEELRHELERVDPHSAARIHPHDRYRTGRALEIHRLTGHPMSEWQRDFIPAPVLGCRFSVLHLSPPRAVLHQRIEARARAWFQGGWPEEVRGLRRDWSSTCPGLGILGYRDVGRYLDGELSAEAALEEIVVGTRQYARQQEIWFRKCDAIWRGPLEDAAALETLSRAVADAAP